MKQFIFIFICFMTLSIVTDS